MKNLKKLLFTECLLLSIMVFGCTKENDDWLFIKEEVLDKNISTKLDDIFSKDNLTIVEYFDDINIGTNNSSLYDPQVSTINSKDEFMKFNNGEEELNIDFSEYTLIFGKIIIPSISNSLSSKTLYYNDFRRNYKFELNVYRPQIGFTLVGEIYFWSIYQKLNPSYALNIEIINLEEN